MCDKPTQQITVNTNDVLNKLAKSKWTTIYLYNKYTYKYYIISSLFISLRTFFKFLYVPTYSNR